MLIEQPKHSARRETIPRRSGELELCNDRILGSGEFVERVIKTADAQIKYQLPVKDPHHDIDEFMTHICESENVTL